MTLSASGISGFSFKRYVEYPDGVFHQVLWGGSPANTPTDFATTKSDVVISSVTGLPLIIPAGALWWERTGKLNVGTTGMPTIVLPGPSNTIGNGAGKTLSDPGNSASVNHFGAVCWIGDVASATARSFVCATHSLGIG